MRVHGTVQGVGFRPYVYRLADELGLAGWVLNDARGVLLEVEGGPERVGEFLDRLAPDAPPLAVVERVEISALAPLGERSFAIRESPRSAAADAPVTPDTATCADCLRELFDPEDRRHRYPFINCTNCGPRFTIVRGVPYDRPLTTMAGFEMCPALPGGVRGPVGPALSRAAERMPRMRTVGPADRSARPSRAHDGPGPGDHVRAAAAALRNGAILAVKGIGGFHLACRADDEAAVSTLRARKHREDKPFALMVSSVGDAASLVELGEVERLCCARRSGRSCSLHAVIEPLRGIFRPHDGEVPQRCQVGRARGAGAGCDAAVLAAASPVAHGCRERAGDDERQRIRRADRLPR